MPFFLDIEMPNNRNFVNYHAIIQIGLVSSGKKLKFISNVNPGKKYLKISKYCMEFTGLTREDLENAVEFPEIYKSLKRYFFANNKIYTWGDKDAIVLNNVCERYKIPLITNLVDYQQELMESCKLDIKPSLSSVSKILNIETDLQLHNALTDAKLLRAVYKRVTTQPEQSKFLLRNADYRIKVQKLNSQYSDIVDFNGEMLIDIPKQQKLFVI
jgi:DNA polymerase III epsilon subunit-like protein